MVSITENVNLKSMNTFGMSVNARWFCSIRELTDIVGLIHSGRLEKQPVLLLGGGSNILFTKNFDGLVIRTANKGITKVSENEDFVRVSVSGGENWHDFVMWAVEHGLGGVENLALIPGNVGSSPIQNIGAYGVELKDSFDSLEAIDLESGEIRTFFLDECRFGYRDSIFKNELRGRMVIWSVTFRLARNPIVKTDYGAIAQELKEMAILKPGVAHICDAVIRIRRSKLPDPIEIGNCGSFFKNPVISAEKAEFLKTSYPSMIGYYLPDQKVKLAAGWLIEQCRWKGFRRGDAGVHPNQALVLVNYGEALGEEILQLSEEIRQSVLEKFDVMLEREVNVI